ncbi:PFL family protein [Acidaminococcus fermentans]|uniref:PFL family protein n=1 Tax=Acidaminococcus fermentans TaxID=905 RepID=UPI00242B6F92|nr:PFL family protein [Acidaminococcus fermentans]MCI6285467.1 PFL family protein [Acidaminococcus fermentans]MDY2853580.1 PFL family protein [Acidaminococcus fermentans]
MFYEIKDVLETTRMITQNNLDVRTITMGISLRDCADPDVKVCAQKIYDKITTKARDLVKVGEQLEAELGVPIIHKRISVTPISLVGEACKTDSYVPLAKALDDAAKAVGVNFIGGFSALVEKGYTHGDRTLIRSIPEALSTTDIVCSSVAIGSTKAGINMDAVREMGQVVKETARRTADQDALGCAKLVIFCNPVQDNPFMAGAFHGVTEPETVINVGVSGPGVVKHALEAVRGEDIGVVAETIKKTAFKITRVGQLVAQEAAKRLNTQFGIIDLSLAPTPAVGDSVAHILEEIGLESCGCPGTTAALAMLNDAVKKGGLMASSYVGGLSGAFIPVSEDAGMIAAVEKGSLTIEKLEAMTCVCSVGLDMIAVPGDTTAETISAVIADEAAVGMINNKTTAVRLIPVPGKKVGDKVEFGGLLGYAPIIAVNSFKPDVFIHRGGRIPAPVRSLTN